MPAPPAMMPSTKESLLNRTVVLGFTFTLLSAFFFAISGAVAKTVYAIGWTPGSVALVRLFGATALLAIPTLIGMRGRWGEVRRHWRTVLIYGLAAMAGCQAFYFVAVQELTVTVALLLEMTAPIMIVFYLWATTRQRPASVTFLGVVISMLGVLLVLDFRGANLTVFGVIMALLAAVCLAIYFLVSANSTVALPPFAFTGLGMAVGAVAVLIVALLGILPPVFVAGDVVFAGSAMSWVWPLIMLVCFTIGAYGFGILGLRLIGATVGAFVNLIEVPLAALAAWIVLRELPTSIQFVGGALILVGIAFVKWGDMRSEKARVAEASCVPGAEDAADSTSRGHDAFDAGVIDRSDKGGSHAPGATGPRAPGASGHHAPRAAEPAPVTGELHLAEVSELGITEEQARFEG